MAFDYRNGVLCAEQVPLDDIARRFGTPCYVYSSAAITAAYALLAFWRGPKMLKYRRHAVSSP